MVEDNSKEDGPNLQFEWNFPMIRLLSASSQKVSSALTSVRGDSIPKRIKDSTPKFRSSHDEVEEESDSETRLSNLQNDIKNLRDGSAINLSQSNNDSTQVRYTGDVFVPLRTSVEPNDEVVIVNESDEDITVESDTFSVDIDSQSEDDIALTDGGVYNISISGISENEVCGAIIVGDVDGEVDLPCEGDVDRELFDSDGGNEYSTSNKGTLSEAADNKERSF